MTEIVWTPDADLSTQFQTATIQGVCVYVFQSVINPATWYWGIDATRPPIADVGLAYSEAEAKERAIAVAYEANTTAPRLEEKEAGATEE